jgi:hypothetical protein
MKKGMYYFVLADPMKHMYIKLIYNLYNYKSAVILTCLTLKVAMTRFLWENLFESILNVRK